MFEIIRLENTAIKLYVFLTDVESIENQINNIYDKLENELGTTFNIIIDSFLRSGYEFNRFIEIKFKNGKYAGSVVVNNDNIIDEIKKMTDNILKSNINLLENSVFSKKE